MAVSLLVEVSVASRRGARKLGWGPCRPYESRLPGGSMKLTMANQYDHPTFNTLLQ